jgi:hypothetical protein
MTAYVYKCGAKAFDRYLFVSQTIKMNPCIFLLFFRQVDKTCQPLDDAMKEGLLGSLKTFLGSVEYWTLVHGRNYPFFTSQVYGSI